MIFIDPPRHITIKDHNREEMVVRLNGQINHHEIHMPFIDVASSIGFIQKNKYVTPIEYASLIDDAIPEIYWRCTHISWYEYSKFTRTSSMKRFQKPFLWANVSNVFSETKDFITEVSAALSSLGYTPIVFPPYPIPSSDILIAVDTEFVLKKGSNSSALMKCPKMCGPCQNCIRGVKMQIFGETP